MVAGGPEPQAAEPKTSSTAHIVQVTAKLTFDRIPVEIDQLVSCGIRRTGTPTAGPFTILIPNRDGHFPTEIPGGGMIVMRLNDQICALQGDKWGSGFPNREAPEGWTPLLTWYDHRDLMQATEGIIYVSETALEAPNGRLKIIEPFRANVPEHPPSEALIAEMLRQEEMQSLQPPGFPHGERHHYLSKFNFGLMNVALRIPESEWRNPTRAILSSERGSTKQIRPKPDFSALARRLDEIEGTGITALPRPHEMGWTDASDVLNRLRDGRYRTWEYLLNLGIPKTGLPQAGTLMPAREHEKRSRNPFYPNRFDDWVPLACRDGVATLRPEEQGLQYWYAKRCSHDTNYKGLDVFGKEITGNPFPLRARLLLDHDTGDLWWIQR